MQAKPLELHPGAEEDYLHTLAWYRDRNVSTAVKFDGAFWQAIHAIEDAPDRWPVYFSHFRRYTLHQYCVPCGDLTGVCASGCAWTAPARILEGPGLVVRMFRKWRRENDRSVKLGKRGGSWHR